jgi:hypothetical protein
MRYRGGGVGHTSTRDTVNRFLEDRHTTDMTLMARTPVDDESDQSSEESDEELHTKDTESPAEGLGEPDLDAEGEDDDNLEEQDDYGYQAEDGNSDDEQEDLEESELPNADGGLDDEPDDEVEGEIEQLGYARY